MGIKIEHIAINLPDIEVSNEQLQKENPDWNMEKVQAKSGVHSRHVASSDKTALDLAIPAVKKLLEETKTDINDIDGVVFCTQSPDYIMPGNAHLVHRHFKMKHNVFAFDYNLACSGYIYGLAIIQGFIKTGLGKKILLINADTYSKYINPKDRSTKVLFGDGAAACLITQSDDISKVLDVQLATSGKEFETFYIPGGGCRNPQSDETKNETVDHSGNVRTLEDIHMNGFSVWSFIQSTVPVQIKDLLKRNQINIDDIDHFIFHQASKLTLDSLVKALKANPEKVHTNIENIGNTVSASIPILLHDVLKGTKIKRGDLVLLSGFGVGLSWGSMLIRF